MKRGQDLQLFIERDVNSIGERHHAEKGLVVLCVSKLAVPHPEVLHHVCDAYIAELSIDLLAGLFPQPQQPACTTACIVQLVTHFEAEPFERYGRALGFVDETLRSSEIERLHHEMYVLSTDVVLTAGARLRLGFDRVQIENVVEDGPLIIEMPANSNRIVDRV